MASTSDETFNVDTVEFLELVKRLRAAVRPYATTGDLVPALLWVAGYECGMNPSIDLESFMMHTSLLLRAAFERGQVEIAAVAQALSGVSVARSTLPAQGWSPPVDKPLQGIKVTLSVRCSSCGESFLAPAANPTPECPSCGQTVHRSTQRGG